MVLLIRAMVYSHRLSIQPPVYLASQFVMHVLTGSCELPDWRKGWSKEMANLPKIVCSLKNLFTEIGYKKCQVINKSVKIMVFTLAGRLPCRLHFKLEMSSMERGVCPIAVLFLQ